MDNASLTNLILNAAGTLLMFGSFLFIIIIKLHLKKREEELNKKLEHLLILSDKLIDHSEDLKDKAIVFDQKEQNNAVPGTTPSQDNSRSKL